VQSVHEGRIYTLKLFCDKDYPDKPPTVRFHSRINMTHVNPETGLVSFYLISATFVIPHVDSDWMLCLCYRIVCEHFQFWLPSSCFSPSRADPLLIALYRLIQDILQCLQIGAVSTLWRTFWLSWRKRWQAQPTGSCNSPRKEARSKRVLCSEGHAVESVWPSMFYISLYFWILSSFFIFPYRKVDCWKCL
jgi:hypothetical protein